VMVLTIALFPRIVTWLPDLARAVR
jgi:hypothetical protein